MSCPYAWYDPYLESENARNLQKTCIVIPPFCIDTTLSSDFLRRTEKNLKLKMLYELCRLGRKNYLFSKNDNGAVDNAVFYSLIETCDIVGVNPLEWLTYALDNLHDNTPPAEITSMLPYYYKKSRK